MVVKARAGTGKTTTIKAAFDYAPEKRILYAVFNKKNQVEAQGKISDKRVDVLTLHSLGLRYIRRVWKDVKADDDVEYDRIRAAGVNENNAELIGMIAKLVGFSKNTCINATRDELQAIAESQIDHEDGLDYIINIAKKVLVASKIRDDQNRISFNDMVWLPVAMGWVRPWYDLSVIDECQDMSVPQLAMARQSSDGRVCVVGDDRQCIYSFRGCHSDGMGMIKLTLRAKELTLATTYRCPRLVVQRAAELVPDYKAAPEAPEGCVTYRVNTDDAKPGDAILSRLNAPLMAMALSLLRRGTPARIEGRDIGKMLVATVNSFKASSVPDFMSKLTRWSEKSIKRLTGTKNSDKKIESIRDTEQTLLAIAEGAIRVKDITDRIFGLFKDTDSDSTAAVVLSSVHKAKGLEWDKVYILTETFRRGRGIEEDNIYYVAITRTKRELVFVGSGVPKRKESPGTPGNGSSIEAAGIKTPACPTFIELPPLNSVINHGGKDYRIVFNNGFRATASPVDGKGESRLISMASFNA